STPSGRLTQSAMKRAQAVLNLHQIGNEHSHNEDEPKMKRIALRVDEGGDFTPPIQEEECRAVRSVLIPYIDDSISERDLFNAVNKLGDVQEVMLFRGAVSRALVVFNRKETAVTVADRSIIAVCGNSFFVDSVAVGTVASI
ncbi:hypothetical protein PMAYCL1PPCAC_14661, partial [Pristionchus mayeri]